MHQDSAGARIGMYGKGIIVGMHQDSASAPTHHPHSPCPYVRGMEHPLVGGTSPRVSHHNESADRRKEI